MKLLFAFGTRPEVIKMAPVILEAKKQNHEVIIAISGQHKDMISPFLDWFNLDIDHNLNIMSENQSLTDITINSLKGYEKIISDQKPDYVIVQGDTTTSFTAALASYYQKTKIAHIEAGLRTYNKYSPFPEEVNRKLISSLADLHFAPTKQSSLNLQREGILKNIFVTGNTSIDALDFTLAKIKANPDIKKHIVAHLPKIDENNKLILLTTHRRENLGENHSNIFKAIKVLLHLHSDIEIIFPVHPNPKVRAVVQQELAKLERVHLIEPLDYTSFVWLMKQSYLILTDSGGVQEEAPHLGKPVIVLRDTTERPEAIAAGCSFLVGTQQEAIVSKVNELLNDETYYKSISKAVNPYGNGKSSELIISGLITKEVNP